MKRNKSAKGLHGSRVVTIAITSHPATVPSHADAHGQAPLGRMACEAPKSNGPLAVAFKNSGRCLQKLGPVGSRLAISSRRNWRNRKGFWSEIHTNLDPLERKYTMQFQRKWAIPGEECLTCFFEKHDQNFLKT